MWQDAALSTNCHPVLISAMNRVVVLPRPCACYIKVLAEISEFQNISLASLEMKKENWSIRDIALSSLSLFDDLLNSGRPII